jgi:outer membrane receptor protein involved in Fe transport
VTSITCYYRIRPKDKKNAQNNNRLPGQPRKTFLLQRNDGQENYRLQLFWRMYFDAYYVMVHKL